jgi:hypothetical protein
LEQQPRAHLALAQILKSLLITWLLQAEVGVRDRLLHTTAAAVVRVDF